MTTDEAIQILLDHYSEVRLNNKPDIDTEKLRTAIFMPGREGREGDFNFLYIPLLELR